MQRAKLNGVELEFTIRGTGDPLVLIHSAVLADGFYPLYVEPRIANGFRVIAYHRRGYGGSDRAAPPFTTAQQAADARALVRELGLSRVHVAGHSYGAAIAIEWALTAPEEVASLALLEPPLLASIPSGRAFWEKVASLEAMFDRGDKFGALDSLLLGVVGPNYRHDIDKSLPRGAFDLALADVDTLFRIELPALREWRFTAEDAGRLHQPVLLVTGTNAAPLFKESHQLMKQWVPHAEELVIEATHGLQYENPGAVADGLARFLAMNEI